MEKLIQEVNKISKWVISKNTTFIGYEWCGDRLFTFIKMGDINIHLEVFFDDVYIQSVLNCYEDKEHLVNFSGNTEDCLKEIDNLIQTMKISNNTHPSPNPPLFRIMREGVTDCCNYCNSTKSKTGFLGLFGEILCHNKNCPNSKPKR